MSKFNWDLYPLWHKEFVNRVNRLRFDIVRAEEGLTNKNFDYAKSMQKMIALYDDVLEVCEQHNPNSGLINQQEEIEKE
jgi:hypothetical protein